MITGRTVTLIYRIVTLSLAGLLSIVPAFAQIEEIIVTAQKREQPIQDVPISISSTSGQTIAEHGLWRMSELSDVVPNLVVQEGVGSSIISSRGLATLGLLNPAFEMSTAMFHDGVYMGKTRQSTNQLFDVNRIEFLRGPQPTYFGQGAIAGAISVISNRPGDEWAGYIRGSYGTDEEVNLDVAYGGPISDTVGIRAAVRYYDTEGYFPFTHRQMNGPQLENVSGRVLFDWAPTDIFDLSLKLEAYQTDMFGVPGSEQINCDQNGDAFCALVATEPFYNRVEWEQNFRGSQGGGPISHASSGPGTGFGPFAGLTGVTLGMLGIVPPGDPAFDVPLCPTCGDIIDVSAYPLMSDMGRDTESETASLVLNLDLGFATLTSQTAYQHFFNEIGWELDGTAAAGFGSHQEDDQDQVSQELRLSSTGAEYIEWMLGFYYQQSDFRTDTDWITAYDGGQFIAVTSPIAPFRHVDTVTDDTWTSVFASVSWYITDSFSIDIGARYTEVDKEAVNVGLSRFLNPDGDVSTPDFGPIIPGSEQRIAKRFSDSSTDPSLAFNWQVREDTKLYLRFAQGFKAGGFGVGITIPEDDPSTPDVDEQDKWVYESEEAEMVELGLKSWLLDNRLTLNVAVFDTDFTNLQVSAFDNDTITFLINNAASAHSRGVEVEGQFQANDRLRLSYAFSLLDAQYDSYPDAQCNKFEPAVGATCDRSGLNLEYASDWSAIFGIDYEPYIAANYFLIFQAQAAFYDGYLVGYNAPNSRQSDFEKINLRLALHTANEDWEFAVYGRNITDSKTVNTLSDGVANGPTEQSFSTNRGASYGVQISYSF